MKIKYPDYENSIANLACSILKHFNADCPDNGTLEMADFNVAIDDLTIFNSSEESNQFMGIHAGLVEEEMIIPLIAISKKGNN